VSAFTTFLSRHKAKAAFFILGAITRRENSVNFTSMKHEHGNTGHSHEHHHGHGGGSTRSMLTAFILTTAFMVVEGVGGYLSNSLALISDAGHMLTDAAALGIGLFAMKLGERPPSVTKSFGYRRFEILAALFNGMALWAIVGVILHEAYARITSPEAVNPVGMVTVASIGLLVNLISIKMLHAHKEESLNVKGAFLHVVADTMGSVGALLAGAAVWLTGWTLVDPLVSAGICALILYSSWGLIKDAVNILLLGVPEHIDYREVEEAIASAEGVCCVYDLHIWAITPGNEALSAHVVVNGDSSPQSKIAGDLALLLKERFNIGHSTIQLESDHGAAGCAVGGLCRVTGARGVCASAGSVVEDKEDCGHDHSR